MRAVLLLAAVAAAERKSWFGSSQKKEKPVTREGRAVQLARKVLEARTLEDAHSLARAAAQLLQTPSKSPPVSKRCSNPSLSRRDARGCQRVVASASARPLTKTALDRGGFLCRALLVLEAAHHRGPASSKRDAHLGAIDAACAFNAKTWRPPAADQHAKKIVVAIHHNGAESVSALQGRLDGVFMRSRHRDAVGARRDGFCHTQASGTSCSSGPSASSWRWMPVPRLRPGR